MRPLFPPEVIPTPIPRGAVTAANRLSKILSKFKWGDLFHVDEDLSNHTTRYEVVPVPLGRATGPFGKVAKERFTIYLARPGQTDEELIRDETMLALGLFIDAQMNWPGDQEKVFFVFDKVKNRDPSVRYVSVPNIRIKHATEKYVGIKPADFELVRLYYWLLFKDLKDNDSIRAHVIDVPRQETAKPMFLTGKLGHIKKGSKVISSDHYNHNVSRWPELIPLPDDEEATLTRPIYKTGAHRKDIIQFDIYDDGKPPSVYTEEVASYCLKHQSFFTKNQFFIIEPKPWKFQNSKHPIRRGNCGDKFLCEHLQEFTCSDECDHHESHCAGSHIQQFGKGVYSVEQYDAKTWLGRADLMEPITISDHTVDELLEIKRIIRHKLNSTKLSLKTFTLSHAKPVHDNNQVITVKHPIEIKITKLMARNAHLMGREAEKYANVKYSQNTGMINDEKFKCRVNFSHEPGVWHIMEADDEIKPIDLGWLTEKTASLNSYAAYSYIVRDPPEVIYARFAFTAGDPDAHFIFIDPLQDVTSIAGTTCNMYRAKTTTTIIPYNTRLIEENNVKVEHMNTDTDHRVIKANNPFVELKVSMLSINFGEGVLDFKATRRNHMQHFSPPQTEYLLPLFCLHMPNRSFCNECFKYHHQPHGSMNKVAQMFSLVNQGIIKSSKIALLNTNAPLPDQTTGDRPMTIDQFNNLVWNESIIERKVIHSTVTDGYISIERATILRFKRKIGHIPNLPPGIYKTTTNKPIYIHVSNDVTQVINIQPEFQPCELYIATNIVSNNMQFFHQPGNGLFALSCEHEVINALIEMYHEYTTNKVNIRCEESLDPTNIQCATNMFKAQLVSHPPCDLYSYKEVSGFVKDGQGVSSEMSLVNGTLVCVHTPTFVQILPIFGVFRSGGKLGFYVKPNITGALFTSKYNEINEIMSFIQRKPRTDHPFTVITGPAGSGKSSKVMDLKLDRRYIVCKTHHALRNMQETATRLKAPVLEFKTYAQLLKYGSKHAGVDLIIDEATQLSESDFSLVVSKLQPRTIHLLGDASQGGQRFSTDVGSFKVLSPLNRPEAHRIVLAGSTRCGKNLEPYIRLFDPNFIGDESKHTEIVFTADLEAVLAVRTEATILTWSRNSAAKMSKHNHEVMLVEAAQGYTRTDVIILIEGAINVNSFSYELWTVALTRAINSVTIVSVNEPVTYYSPMKFLEAVKFVIDFNDSPKVGTFMFTLEDYQYADSISSHLAMVSARTLQLVKSVINLGTALAALTNPVTATMLALKFGTFAAVTVARIMNNQPIELNLNQHPTKPWKFLDMTGFTLTPEASWLNGYMPKLASLATKNKFAETFESAKNLAFPNIDTTVISTEMTRVLDQLRSINIQSGQMEGDINLPLHTDPSLVYVHHRIAQMMNPISAALGFPISSEPIKEVNTSIEEVEIQSIIRTGLLPVTFKFNTYATVSKAGLQTLLGLIYSITKLQGVASLNVSALTKLGMQTKHAIQNRRFIEQQYDGIPIQYSASTVMANLINLKRPIKPHFSQFDVDFFDSLVGDDKSGIEELAPDQTILGHHEYELKEPSKSAPLPEMMPVKPPLKPRYDFIVSFEVVHSDDSTPIHPEDIYIYYPIQRDNSVKAIEAPSGDTQTEDDTEHSKKPGTHDNRMLRPAKCENVTVTATRPTGWFSSNITIYHVRFQTDTNDYMSCTQWVRDHCNVTTFVAVDGTETFAPNRFEKKLYRNLVILDSIDGRSQVEYMAKRGHYMDLIASKRWEYRQALATSRTEIDMNIFSELERFFEVNSVREMQLVGPRMADTKVEHKIDKPVMPLMCKLTMFQNKQTCSTDHPGGRQMGEDAACIHNQTRLKEYKEAVSYYNLWVEYTINKTTINIESLEEPVTVTFKHFFLPPTTVNSGGLIVTKEHWPSRFMGPIGTKFVARTALHRVMLRPSTAEKVYANMVFDPPVKSDGWLQEGTPRNFVVRGLPPTAPVFKYIKCDLVKSWVTTQRFVKHTMYEYTTRFRNIEKIMEWAFDPNLNEHSNMGGNTFKWVN
nr:MAG: helicase [Ceratobasidium cereale]